MLFCKKCGSILVPKRSGRKTVLACPSCGSVNKQVHEVKLREEIVKKDKKMGVLERDTEKMLPLTNTECPKCKHSRAYYWTLQTRAGDEPETKFLRCEKCKHTWREYD